MALAFDTGFELADGSAPGSPVTTTGTVANVANRVMVGFMADKNPALTGFALSWNGVDMGAQLGEVSTALGFRVHLFKLIAPAVGVGLTLSGSWTGGSALMVIGAAIWDGADQTNGVKTFTTNTGLTNIVAPNVTIAGFTAGNAVFAGRTDENGSSSSVTTGTEIWEERGVDGNYGGARSTTDTVAWSLGSSVPWAVAAVEVIVAGTASTDELQASRRSPVLSVP